jgi:hypothetical protein
MAMLHFADPSTQTQSSKLRKLQFFIDHCRIIFKDILNPHSQVCIDESIVRTNRKGMPKLTKNKKGEVQAFYSAAPLMALKWQEKKSVTVLSTMHDSGMIPTLNENRTTGLPKIKTKCVDEYTKNIGSVDTADMMMSSITCIRKTRKWFKKLAFRLFDMPLLNAFSL